MPAQRSPVKRKIKRKPYKPPRQGSPDAADRNAGRPTSSPPKAGPPTPTRPSTPTARPGPFTDKERRKVRRHKKKPSYRKALREARKKGPGLSRGNALSEGATGKSDDAREKAQDYVRKQYKREYGDDYRKFYEPRTTIPPGRTAERRAILRRIEREGVEKAESPAVKALEQTTRPLHGLAAGTRAAIKGKNVPKAVGRGLANKDKSTFSDVLKDVGVDKIPVVGKPAAAVGGFALDVALDPTTYVTGGTGSVLKKTAQKAADDARKKALKQGLTKEQAERFGKRAEKQTLKKGGTDSRGVTVRFAGKEAPGVRKATAKAGKVVKRTTDKPKAVRKTKEGSRRVAADVNPNITPDNLPREQFRQIRRAGRTARSTTSAEVRRAKGRGAAFRKAIGKADQEIIDAVEAGPKALRKLSKDKRRVAKRYQDELKYARRVERRAGIPVKKRERYVPHVVKERAEAEGGRRSVGAKTIKPSFAKGRKEQRTLKEIRKTDPGKYVEDAPALLANRLVESGVARSKADLNRTLADMGQRVKKGDEINAAALADKGEAVFHVKGSNIRELNLKDTETVRELQRFVDGNSSRGGQYVILNSQAVNQALKNVQPQLDRTEIGRIIDKAQGGWKWLATVPNPGFHVRNLAGGVANAYLYAPGHKLPLNLAQAGKVLAAVGRSHEATRELAGTAKGKGSIHTKRYGMVSLDEAARKLEKAGAIRGGFVGREIPELLDDEATKGVKIGKRGQGKAGRTGRAIARVPRNIEDLPRAATALEALRRGATWEEAAEVAAKFHFDYSDLTALERRVFRRVMPFYTFSARNIPLQLKSYFKRPGKFANYQKVREEVAKAFGLDLDEAERGMEVHEARAAPFVVKWKGQTLNLSLGPSGLPLTDLNEMPVTANPVDWADEWLERGMSLVTPILKSPVEYWANFSFFFRDQIERETGPLVPAPAYVKTLPKPLRDKLGVVDDYQDPRTGKKGWGWPAKLDYIANQLSPGPLGAAKRVLTPSERKGQGTGSKALSYVGVRAKPLEPLTKQINDLYEERSKLGKKRSALNQRGMNAESPTAEWSKVNTRYNAIDDEIAALRAKRGDKVIRRRGRPKSTSSKRSSSSRSTGGFFNESPPSSSRSSRSRSSSGGGFFNNGGSSSSSSSGQSSGGGFFNP